MKKVYCFLLLFMTSIVVVGQNQVKGYEKSVEIKGSVGLDDQTDYAFGVSMVNGYRFNNYLYLGAGVGYEYLKGLYYRSYQYIGHSLSTEYDSKDVRNIIQLYARVKANFTRAKISPFASVDLGNSFSLGSSSIKMANGFFFEPAIGCDFRLNEKQTFYCSLGYNHQRYEYDFFNLTYGSTEHKMQKKPSGTLCVHLGLFF